jgi:2-dehydro-3-deoxygluconokinase
MLDVMAFGEAMLRLSVSGGETLDGARSFDAHVGGSEANACVALAALGRATAWVSALPDNPLGRRVAAELRGAGVSVDAVEWVPGARLGTFFVEHGVPPRPTSVVYDRAGSAFAVLDGWPQPPGPARWALVSGISAAVAPQGTLDFAAAATAAGARLCVDVNHRELLWSAEAARAGLEPLLARADLVVCAARDLATVIGLPADDDGAAELLERWAPAAEALVVTHGDRGAVAHRRDGRSFAAPGTPAQVVDRLGAGDAFAAGLLHGLLDGDLELGLRRGVALGARAVTLRGDHVRLGARELDRLLDHPDRSVIR